LAKHGQKLSDLPGLWPLGGSMTKNKCNIPTCSNEDAEIWSIKPDAKLAFCNKPILNICMLCLEDFLEKNPIAEEHLLIKYNSLTIDLE